MSYLYCFVQATGVKMVHSGEGADNIMTRYLYYFVQATGVKMVLSGEGADEIMAGYLYFHKAPNPEELHKETVR